jgi:hypothetical protein
MAEFDQAFADKALNVRARLVRQGKFVDMDVIEDVLRLGAEADAEAAQARRAAAGVCGCSLLDYADVNSQYDTCKCGHDSDEHAISGECEAVVTPSHTCNTSHSS